MSKKKLDKYQQGGEPQYQGELPIKRNNISKLISGFLNKVRPIVGESAATISEALYNAVPFEDLRSIVAEESGADISGIKDMYEQVLSEYSTYLNTPPAKNTKVAKVLINGEEKTALLDPKTKSVLNVFQQGGKPNPNQLYGDAGDYLSNIMGGINSNPLFNTKTNPAAKTRDQLVKEMGLYYKTGGSFLYKNRWIDPKTGQEYFAEDLDKMVGQSNTDAISSTKAFNESLPLAKQLSALFDIQQKGNEEIENAKPILQDFQPLAASFAPRGFAQQGGAADGQGQTKVMPSTDAIIGGLPKEMSADDVAMVAKNAAKEQIRATREKLNEAYETLLEDAETKLRQKLALKGLDEETADSFIEDLYQNNFPVFDEDLPESFSPIRKATIEDVKAKFGIFLPDLKDEVENIYNIEKGLKERFTDLSRKELELEMGVESKTTDRKPKREGFKYFQQGGAPNNLQQILGYKDNSPFRNMASQDFYTDTLTMSGVSKPLLAIANNGQTKIMKPNSGLYNFPGATKITEIPLAQEGGSASTAGCKPKLNNNDEITKLLGMNRYKIMPNLIATMQQGGIIKLKSDEGDPYQYEFDQTTGDYYTITPQGKRIKLKKGSAAEQEVARRSQWQINKGSYQNKYSSGFIDTDSYRYLIPNDNTVPPDSVDSYGTVDGHGDVFMREKIGVKKGGVRILPLNESKAAKIRMQKEYGRQAIDPINAYVPISDLKDSFKYNPVTGDIIEETEEWDDTLGKPVKVRKKVRGDAYDRMRDVIRKRGTAVGLVPAEDEYTKREGSFFGRLYNDFLFQSGGSPTYKIENDLDSVPGNDPYASKPNEYLGADGKTWNKLKERYKKEFEYREGGQPSPNNSNKYKELPQGAQLDYFNTLAPYVEQYGIQALANKDAEAAEFFVDFFESDYRVTLPEVTISAQRIRKGSGASSRQQEKKSLVLDTIPNNLIKTNVDDVVFSNHKGLIADTKLFKSKTKEEKLYEKLLKAISIKDDINTSVFNPLDYMQQGGSAWNKDLVSKTLIPSTSIITPIINEAAGINWLKDWISNPEFSKRLKDNINSNNKNIFYGNDYADKIINSSLSEISNTKFYTGNYGQDRLLKENLIKPEDAEYLAYTKGVYSPSGKFVWTRDNDPEINVHEYIHASGLDDFMTKSLVISEKEKQLRTLLGLKDSSKFVIDPGGSYFIDPTDENFNVEKAKKDYKDAFMQISRTNTNLHPDDFNYLNNSKEVYPRLMQMRIKFGIKPGEKVTKEKMNYIFDNSYDNIFDIYSKEEIQEMLNRLASNLPKNNRGIYNAKQGGRPTPNNNDEITKLLSLRKYMNGGRVVQNYMPVGNGKTKVESYIPLEAMLPIQTEKKELIVLPTMDLVKVNASKRHSQMSEDQVTDVVPENSYILSQFGKVDIYKSEADQAIVEVQNKPYNIYGANPEPKTKSLGDYMSKKKMKPADLGRTLLNKYKQMNNPGDPFTEQTNAANKYTLSKYLEVLIGLSEMDKARKGLNDDNSVTPQMFAKDGGRVLRTGYSVPKAQVGAIIGGASALISGIGSLFTNAKNRKLLQQNTAASLFDIGNLYKQQTGLENTALAANLMGFAAQNPEIKPVLENTNFLDATQRFIPQQQTDYLMGRALANRPDVTGMDPRLANGITGRYYAQALDNQSNFALQASQARIGFLNNYLQQKQAAENRNVASRTNAFNATTANMNSLLAGSAGAISGSMTNRQNLLTNKLNATLAARGQQTSGLMALNNQLLQGLTNSAALGLQAYNSIQNNNSQDPNKPVPQNQLCQPPIQGCPQGSFWSYVQCRCI